MSKIVCSALTVAPDIALYHTGPALDHGPLPSIFYFALSGPDSLTVDPFNQPVQFLRGRMIRFFSLTLPAHEAGLPPQQAFATWAEEVARGVNPFGPFFEAVDAALDFAIRHQFVDSHRLGLAGLSRGGLITSHLAARDKRFRAILQYAPVTSLGQNKEFTPLQNHPWVQTHNAETVAPLICDRHIRLYIGNHDTLVSTRSCFDFSQTLVEEAKKTGIRTPQVEFIMSPSIGHKGHGTPPEIFRQGILWLGDLLETQHRG